MILVTEDLPKEGQKVLIDLGNYIDPAIYEDGRFNRYPNHAEGDRTLSYFYSGVIAWMPFPKASKASGFVSEPELPFPTPDMSIPLTKDEEALLYPGKKAEAYHRKKDDIPVELQVALCLPPIM